MVATKVSGYGIWAIVALFAAAIVYAMFFAGSRSNRQFTDSCFERRARSFPAELPSVFRDQIIHDCEMELRKSKKIH